MPAFITTPHPHTRILIGLREVAAMMDGTHPEHVRRVLSKRSDFPAQFRIGTRVMFDRAEIATWVDAQCLQTGGDAATDHPVTLEA